MPKAKHPLLRNLQRHVVTGNTVTAENKRFNKSFSRRDFLKTTGQAAAALGISSLLPSCTHPIQIKPRVAIVGAGIAGLNAAHYLKTQNIAADIYEASGRTGGRILTMKNSLLPGYTTEIGGEFIDSGHCEMITLAQKFGLELKDNEQDPLNENGLNDTYFIGGKRYSLQQVLAEFNHYKKAIDADFRSLGDNVDTPQAFRLDQLSIAAYFDKLGMNGWLRILLENAYVAEFGLAAGEQSSLNFITMIADQSDANKLQMYGISDERFGIKGGNELVIEKLADYVRPQINHYYQLAAISSKGRGYVLSFNNGREVFADFVIMAIPFTILRTVDMRIDNMSKEKLHAIKTLGYGNNSKLIMGFNKRIWRDNYHTPGYLFNEAIQNGWDSTHQQHDNDSPGTYTIYTGAQRAKQMADMAAQHNKHKDEYLPLMDNIFNGSKQAFNGNIVVADWPNQPLIRASYAAYKVGQWSTVAGLEAEPVDNLFFAGEHCSGDFQGYMNGGAETGKQAAIDLLAKLNIQLQNQCESV